MTTWRTYSCLAALACWWRASFSESSFHFTSAVFAKIFLVRLSTGSFQQLRALIHQLGRAACAIDEQELFDLLVLHRRNLVSMFETKPPRAPSEDERKELQSGAYFILFKSTQTNLLKPGKCTVSVDGRQMSVNGDFALDFATQVIYLVRILGCSERYITGLMQL